MYEHSVFSHVAIGVEDSDDNLFVQKEVGTAVAVAENVAETVAKPPVATKRRMSLMSTSRASVDYSKVKLPTYIINL